MNGPESHDEQLDKFEEQLARAMRPADPPFNFAAAVMERAARDERPAARVLPMQTRWRTVQMWAAGAVAAMVIAGVGFEHVQRTHERAEATRQFEIATQIEQQALDRTRERLSRSGISLEPQ